VECDGVMNDRRVFERVEGGRDGSTVIYMVELP